jgi:hypothetical protein
VDLAAGAAVVATAVYLEYVVGVVYQDTVDPVDIPVR